MKILMLTNMYTPQIGGITRSIQSFAEQFRRRGHRVVIVAPHSEREPKVEFDVVRHPAVPNIYQRRYSLPIPAPGFLFTLMADLGPDLIHTHHPFLLGSVAQREAAIWNLPIIYTHHTRYDAGFENHVRFAPVLKEWLLNSWAGFCNLCDAVVAPSAEIAAMLRDRGVTVDCRVIPTGVDLDRFAKADGAVFRRRFSIPQDAYAVGYVGRLSAEKNLEFLCEGAALFLKRNPAARFLVIGDGPMRATLEGRLHDAGVRARAIFTGMLDLEAIADAYRTLDLFVFASLSETQGMVLLEAMAAGVPVVALDASGVREAVSDRTGKLVQTEDPARFAEAMQAIANLPPERLNLLRASTRAFAAENSIDVCAEKMLALYQQVIEKRKLAAPSDDSLIATSQRFLEYEWNSWSNIVTALGQSIIDRMSQEEREAESEE